MANHGPWQTGFRILVMILSGCGSPAPDPCVGAACVDPCVGAACADPCDGGACADPCDGGACADPCDGVACSDHGLCEVVAGSASCTCDDGYEADDGLTCVETVGPVISDVSAFEITQTTAKITWTLSEPATGQTEYGTTAAYGQASRREDSFDYSTHVQNLSNLAPATLYHFRVRSSNEAGAESISGDYTFTTLGAVLPACAPAPTDPTLVDVTDTGATGDGATDDTAAIQAAVDQVAGTGGTVLVPDGTYRIDALESVRLGSQMTFRMSSGATLRAFPNGSTSYAIIRIDGVSDVNVIGGTLQGEREEHTGIDGQWGMGLGIYGATRVVVEGVTARDCWGDGFYLGGAATVDATFCGVVGENDRRQGMSIVSASGVVIRDSVFTGTNGHAPQAGLDIEPNEGQSVQDVQILSSQFTDNLNFGLVLWAGAGPIENVRVEGSSFTGNRGGIVSYHTSGHQMIDNTIVDDAEGIHLVESTRNVITGNTITAPRPIVGDDGGNTIEGNVFP